MIRNTTYNINRQLPGVILISHGSLAKGMSEAVEMVYGKSDNLVAIGYEVSDSPEDYGKAIKETIDLFPMGAVILADLFGGTPFNQCLINILGDVKSGNIKVSVIAGMNFGMVLEVLSNLESSSISKIEDIAVNAGHSAVVNGLERFRK